MDHDELAELILCDVMKMSERKTKANIQGFFLAFLHLKKVFVNKILASSKHGL